MQLPLHLLHLFVSRTQRSLKLNLNIIAMRRHAWVYPNTQGSISAILAHTHLLTYTYSYALSHDRVQRSAGLEIALIHRKLQESCIN